MALSSSTLRRRSPRTCPGAGPLPSPIFLCGEKPGETEIRNKRPFSGRSGEEQDAYLRRYNLSTRRWYLTNIVKHFIRDRQPDYQEILDARPEIDRELAACLPSLIIAVGAVASRFFLGESTALETVHGIPHKLGAFDKSIRRRLSDIFTARGYPFPTVLPIYHVASAFHDKKGEMRPILAWDYSRVAECVTLTLRDKPIPIRHDRYAGKEKYSEITGREFEHLIRTSFDFDANEIAIDTEGWYDSPFSIQFSWREGEGYFVRYEAKDFHIVRELLTYLALRKHTRIILHNALHDIPVLLAMGIDLRRANIWDTMYAAYLTRLDSYEDDPKGRRRSKQGLKPLAYRHCAMEMRDHDDLTREIGKEKRFAYLQRILDYPTEWPHPGRIIEQQHNGQWTIYKPNTIIQYVNGILRDIAADKRNKHGEPVDIEERWKKIHARVRGPVEEVLGSLPHGGVRDVYERDKEAAIRYGCADSDGTLRLKSRLHSELKSRNLLHLHDQGMRVLPAFIEMQSTGLFASRSYFEQFSSQLWDEMMAMGEEISTRFMDGVPFNPKSPDQTRILLESRGLKSEKETATGLPSTGKKAIEHLRHTDPAMSLLQEWREREHIRDAFCAPVLRRIPEDTREDVSRITCQVLNTRTATRRLAERNPNFLAIPVRSELGNRVRAGYSAPPGFVYLSADMSQIEFRILAHFCADPTLLDLFNSGADIHSQTAYWIFDDIPITLEQAKEKKYRAPAKTINYGFVYLQSPIGMAETLRKEGIIWDTRKCDKYQRKVRDLYPGIDRYVESTRRETYKLEMASSAMGMPRYLPGIRSKDRGVAAESLRFALSQKIQGTASDMVIEAMIWLIPRIWELQDEGYGVWWVNWIHDEIMMMAEEEIAERVLELLIEALSKHHGMRMRVPILAEGKIGKNWGELK